MTDITDFLGATVVPLHAATVSEPLPIYPTWCRRCEVSFLAPGAAVATTRTGRIIARTFEKIPHYDIECDDGGIHSASSEHVRIIS